MNRLTMGIGADIVGAAGFALGNMSLKDTAQGICDEQTRPLVEAQMKGTSKLEEALSSTLDALQIVQTQKAEALKASFYSALGGCLNVAAHIKTTKEMLQYIPPHLKSQYQSDIAQIAATSSLQCTMALNSLDDAGLSVQEMNDQGKVIGEAYIILTSFPTPSQEK